MAAIAYPEAFRAVAFACQGVAAYPEASTAVAVACQEVASAFQAAAFLVAALTCQAVAYLAAGPACQVVAYLAAALTYRAAAFLGVVASTARPRPLLYPLETKTAASGGPDSDPSEAGPNQVACQAEAFQVVVPTCQVVAYPLEADPNPVAYPWVAAVPALVAFPSVVVGLIQACP